MKVPGLSESRLFLFALKEAESPVLNFNNMEKQ